MMARRIPGILPNLTFEEALEITKIHSIAGTLSQDTPIITKRPFRSPHHTVSASSLVRRRKNPKTRRNQPSTLRSPIPRRTTRIRKKHPRSSTRPIRRQNSNNKPSKCKPNISMQLHVHCINEPMPMWLLWLTRQRVHLYTTSNRKIHGKNQWTTTR